MGTGYKKYKEIESLYDKEFANGKTDEELEQYLDRLDALWYVELSTDERDWIHTETREARESTNDTMDT